jgi:2,3-bisphosphoglycerate-independent phosphoglycerate mutase
MAINWSDFFSEVAADNGYNVRRYSGRGMYGKECLGVVIKGNPLSFLGSACGMLADYVSDNSAAEEAADENQNLIDALQELSEIIDKTQQDSMGLDIIIYWPRLAAPPEDSEEE